MDYYEPLRHVVTQAEDGWKLRTVLQVKMLISRRLLVRLKHTEHGILLNGERKYLDVHVTTGDCIEVRMPQEQSDEILPQPMDLSILHEDEHILVLDKPAGMIVHPTHGHYINTLANGVVHYWKQSGVRCRFRPVHRLDQETSGVLLIAKTPFAHQFVSLQLVERTVIKEYVALVHGRIHDDEGEVDAPIDRLPDDPHRRAVLAGGAPAVTRYWVERKYTRASLVRLRLLSGRTHQIRVHMEHLGHPLLGDLLYGEGLPDARIGRQALHARRLGFRHPGTRDWVEYESELPPDMEACIRHLEWEDGNDG